MVFQSVCIACLSSERIVVSGDVAQASNRQNEARRARVLLFSPILIGGVLFFHRSCGSSNEINSLIRRFQICELRVVGQISIVD